MRPKRIVGIIALVLVLVGIAWLAISRGPNGLSDRQKVHAVLTLKWLYDPGFAGEMVALKRGDFLAEQIELSIQPGGFEINPVTLVANGASQFGVAGADTFLIARSRGIPIVAIAGGYIQTPVAFYSHADSGIKSLADLKGKTVGVQAGQDTETIFAAMLGTAGISSSEIKTYPAKYDLSPFLQRTVDVWPGYIATQSYTLRQQGVPFSVIRPKDIGLNIPGTVYFTSEKFLREHPQVVAGFVRAVKRGWAFTYEHQEEAARLVSSYDTKSLPVPLVLANFKDQRDQIIPEGYSYGEMRTADWEVLRKILEQQKLLVGPVNLADALKPPTE